MEVEQFQTALRIKYHNLPHLWAWKRLKELGKVGSGNTPSKEVVSFWSDGDIPWLPTGKVNDRVISKSETFITQEAVRKNSIKLLPVGTVLIAMIGQGQTRGRAALLNLEAWVNQNFAYIIPNATVSSMFLFSTLEFRYERIRYEGDRGGNQGSLNGDMVKNIKIPLPPLPQQRKIAAILSTWDEAIQTADQLLKAKQERKRGLMQQLLSGKKRLPGFLGDWREVTLGEVFQRVQRNNRPDVEAVLSISAKKGFVSQTEKFSRVIAGENLTNYTLLKKGEFAYNKGNSDLYPCGCIYKLDSYNEAAVPNVYFCFKSLGEVDEEFYKFYFQNRSLDRQLHQRINSGVRNDGLLNLNANEFFEVKIVYPPLDEQRAIAAVLNAADEEIRPAKAEVDALKQQKRGLMQELLTGKTLVNVQNEAD